MRPIPLQESCLILSSEKTPIVSFLEQTNKNTELIVISDNCKITEKLYNENYKENDLVKQT